jgi:hypothetical protein
VDLYNGKYLMRWIILWLLVIPGIVLNLGCQHREVAKSKSPRVLPIKKVVAVGFIAALSEKEQPSSFQNRLSGSMVDAEPVSRDVVRKVNDIMLERVAAEKNYDLLPRSEAIGVYLDTLNSDKSVGMPMIEIVQEVGTKFNADAVLIGYLYRWREREGSSYSVKRAASVSFDLHLIQSNNGAIIWKSMYDKTQHSLSENLFDLGTFKESGGKWLTVEKLGEIGLRKIIEEMPPGEDKE